MRIWTTVVTIATLEMRYYCPHAPLDSQF